MDVRCCKCGSSNGGERQKEERREEEGELDEPDALECPVSLVWVAAPCHRPNKKSELSRETIVSSGGFLLGFCIMTTTLNAHTIQIEGSGQHACLLLKRICIFILFFSKHAKVRCSQPGGLNRCKSHLSKCSLSQSKGAGQTVWVAVLRDLRAESLLGLYLDLSI